MTNLPSNPQINIEGLKPFKKFCMTIGALPSSYLESLTYLELLLWFCDYLKNTIIPAINNNAEAVEELQNLYVELKNYVDNYFNNLDVQDEINNKLDEMSESGELQEIISEFLKLKSTLTFDTVSDMLASSNLIAGSYAKTLGFYSLNDGGANYFKIRNPKTDEQANNITTYLTSSNLIAELIIENNTISLLQVGGKPDGTEDIAEKIEYLINTFPNGITIFIPSGQFLCSNVTINKKVQNLNIIGQGFQSVLYNNTNSWTLEFLDQIMDSYFTKFAIWCNNIASGIKFSKNNTGNNARCRLDYVSIRNTVNGMQAHNCVYLNCNNLQISCTISNTNITNNYCLDLDGYEYNNFDTCSFNADGKTDQFPSVIFHSSNWTIFNNCEFASTNIGILFNTENVPATLQQVIIKNCKLYRLYKAFDFELYDKGCINFKILDNNIYLNGDKTDENYLLIKKNSSSVIQNLIFQNNTLFRINSTASTSSPIHADDDSLINSAIINNNFYAERNYLDIGNNVLSQFSDLSAQRIRSQSITGDGSTTTFTIYNASNLLPIMTKCPIFLGNFRENINIPYFIRTFYNTSDPTQLRAQIVFATPPPTGEYNFDYHLVY